MEDGSNERKYERKLISHAPSRDRFRFMGLLTSFTLRPYGSQPDELGGFPNMRRARHVIDPFKTRTLRLMFPSKYPNRSDQASRMLRTWQGGELYLTASLVGVHLSYIEAIHTEDTVFAVGDPRIDRYRLIQCETVTLVHHWCTCLAQNRGQYHSPRSTIPR